MVSEIFRAGKLWVLPYVIVFSAAIFILGTVPAGVLFGLLLLFYLGNLIYFKVKLEGENLTVDAIPQIWRKASKIPISSVEKVFVRETPILKLFNLKDILIKFDDPAFAEAMEMKAFGMNYKYQLFAFPGFWGNFIYIPAMPSDVAEHLISSLELVLNKKIDVENLGVALPYYRALTRLVYWLEVIIVLLVAILLLISLLSLLVLKLETGF